MANSQTKYITIFLVSSHCPLGFPCGSAGKESSCNAGDLGSIPGLRKFPGEGKGYPLQYSGLENSMDYIAHGVAKSRTRLSEFHTHILLVSRKCADVIEERRGNKNI